MAKSGLTGSRIRERRLTLGLRQTVLAQSAGISPAYLNLIEHNRRRIGGKLLMDIAGALGVESTVLTEGAEAALLEGLRDAAAGQTDATAELDRVEDFAGRFPGWADLLARQHQRVVALERTAAALTDRLTHDPQLASSLHEVLSVVTAIRSTSAILADTGDVDPEWQSRFHRNLYEDSQRLAESSQALVEYLDSAVEDDSGTGILLPQEELENWLAGQGFHVAELEGEAPVEAEDLARKLSAGPAATAMARQYLTTYAQDSAQLPLQAFLVAIDALGLDPARLAAHFQCDLTTVFRRIASLPDTEDLPKCGLVQCDGSGTLTFRKPIEGFALPRFGAACPLWPLYQALGRPMSPIRALVEQSGRTPQKFLTYAISVPSVAVTFDTPQVFSATMLIVPEHDENSGAATPLAIGSSCRICPRTQCAARREPSILTS